MVSEIVKVFLDFLIPPIGKSSIGGASAWQHSISREKIELRLHNFLSEEVSKNRMSLEQAQMTLFLKHRIFYDELAEILIQDYFQNEDTKQQISQNFPAPMPKGYKLPATDWSILEQVVENAKMSQKFNRKS